MKDAAIENLYTSMLDQLRIINGSLKESVSSLDGSLSCVSQTISELREYRKTHPFTDDADEIYFFKYIKPRFSCWRIYLVELHKLLAGVPVGTEQMIRDYYTHEMSVLSRFFRQHSFYYQYYLADEFVKDAVYFLRRNRSAYPPEQELSALDREFSTDLDHLFALFRAYEMLRDFLIKRIRLLYQEPDGFYFRSLKESQKRWWSGDKVELVEMAYGIYYTRRLNGGKADISDIISWLEESLNIDLAQAYRMFVDISRRKTLSYTKYLDEMRTAIHGHIDESLKLKKQHGRRKN